MSSSCESFMSSEMARWWGIEPSIAIGSFIVWMQLFRVGEVHENFLQRTLNPPFHFLFSGICSIVFYWIGIVLWVMVVPPPVGITSGCISDAHSALTFLIECASGLIAYDFLFYWFHLCMHASPRVFRLMDHGRHHEFDGSSDKRAESSFRTTHHSILDGGMQVICNILVQRYTPWGPAKSRLARWRVP